MISRSTRATTLVDVVQPGTRPLLWDISLVVGFGTLMGMLAQISIPLPFTPVPVTGQTFGVLLTGALLGSRRGSAAMLVYLAEGIEGLPVFALGHSGLATILGPTGGYLVSYPVAAFAVGFLTERGWDRAFLQSVTAMVLGEVVIYTVALSWLAHFVGSSRVLALGFVPFLPGDVAKLLLAAAVLPSGWWIIRSLRPL